MELYCSGQTVDRWTVLFKYQNPNFKEGLKIAQLNVPEVPQSPDARLSLASVVRGFISISKAKMQEKNSKGLKFQDFYHLP